MPLPIYALIYLFILTIVTAIVDDQPYCALRYKRLCQGKGRHVGCLFPEPGPGEYCTNYTKIIFTRDVKIFITNYINRRRQRIAAGTEKVRGGVLLPKPGIMMLVEWDRELAFLAQRFADQCNFSHDECRATVRYPYAGQTVGEVNLRRSSESDELTAQKAIRRVFDAWWGERRRVLPNQLMSPFKLNPKGSVWGHFSQLAVWTLRAVGCGAVLHGHHYPHLLLVCDFSHTNMLGQKTILPGPIAPCPLHTARRPRSAYPLLCAAVRRPVSTDKELQDDWERELSEDQNFENEEEDHRNLENVNVTRKYGIVLKVSSRRPQMEIHDKVATTKDSHVEQKRRLDDSKQNGRFENQRERKGGRLHSWYSRRPHLEMEKPDKVATEFGENHHEKDPYAATFSRRYTMSPTTVIEISSYETSSVLRESLLVRRRYKFNKDRPKRPGANALLNKPFVNILTRRPSIASLLLDKEDVNQFIADTGFNPQWRTHT